MQNNVETSAKAITPKTNEKVLKVMKIAILNSLSRPVVVLLHPLTWLVVSRV